MSVGNEFICFYSFVYSLRNIMMSENDKRSVLAVKECKRQ